MENLFLKDSKEEAIFNINNTILHLLFDGQYSSLTGAPTNVSAFTNDAGYITNADDADADPTNEIQTISKSGNTVTLSNSGGSFTDNVNDADTSTTNELQSLSISGQTLLISSGNSVTLPNNSLWSDLGNDLRPAGFENVVSGGDLITSARNGVINCGGGAMSTSANIISDVAPNTYSRNWRRRFIYR